MDATKVPMIWLERKGMKKAQDSSSTEILFEELVTTDNSVQTEAPEMKNLRICTTRRTHCDDF